VLIGVTVGVLVTVLALFLLSDNVFGENPAGGHPRAAVVAALPFWSMGTGTTAVLAERQAVTEASPWIYGLSPSGAITPQYDSRTAVQVNGDMQRLRAAGLPLTPTLANTTHGKWSYAPVAAMLHDQARMRSHIADIVGIVQRERFAGIDIDYEDLRATDRDAFSDFVQQLATALHADNKTLSVAVFAKTDDAGSDPRNVAQDYAAIGRAADQVRLMGYDYHWSTSPPGSVAPIGWIRAVLSYAKTQIPPDKILLGIAVAGYDWVGDKGTPVSWQQADQLAKDHRVPVRTDPDSGSPWFTYTDGQGRVHQVWFENAASTKTKLDAVRDAGIGGAFLWMYGPADPGTWPALDVLGAAGTETGSPG
jgi:spore germination protein YaaH